MKTEHSATGQILVCLVSLFMFKVNWCGKNQINWLSKLSPSRPRRSACTRAVQHTHHAKIKQITNITLVFVYLYIVCSFFSLRSSFTFKIQYNNKTLRKIRKGPSFFHSHSLPNQLTSKIFLVIISQ